MSYKISTIVIAATITLFLQGLATAGKVYKWVDESGTIQYSQTPPPGHKVKELNVKTPKASTPAKTTANTNKKAKQKSPANAEQKTAQQKEIEAKNAEITKENCKRAQTHQRTINAGGRFYDVNEQGERVYWDDSMLKAKQEEAQKAVEKWCNE